jgi:molybdopterin converting factor small subunit
VGDLVRDLARGLEGIPEGLLQRSAVAVNREYVGWETKLHDGDEVALLPPVSGGLR